MAVDPAATDVKPAAGVGYTMSEAIRGGNLNDAVLDEERGLYVHPGTGETWKQAEVDQHRELVAALEAEGYKLDPKTGKYVKPAQDESGAALTQPDAPVSQFSVGQGAETASLPAWAQIDGAGELSPPELVRQLETRGGGLSASEREELAAAGYPSATRELPLWARIDGAGEMSPSALVAELETRSGGLSAAERAELQSLGYPAEGPAGQPDAAANQFQVRGAETSRLPVWAQIDGAAELSPQELVRQLETRSGGLSEAEREELAAAGYPSATQELPLWARIDGAGEMSPSALVAELETRSGGLPAAERAELQSLGYPSLDEVIEPAQGYVGPQQDEYRDADELGAGTDTTGTPLRGVTELGAGVDTDRTSAFRVHGPDVPDPDVTLRSDLPTGEYPEAATAPDGALEDSAVNAGSTPPMLAQIEASVAAHNAQLASKGGAQPSSDLGDAGEGRAMELLTNINADNFEDTINRLPRFANINNERVDLRSWLLQGEVFADADPQTRAIELQSISNRYGQRAEELSRLAKTGGVSFGATAVAITKPDLQSEVFTGADTATRATELKSIESANARLTADFAQKVEDAKNSGQYIVLEEAPTFGEKVRDDVGGTLLSFTPGYGLYELGRTVYEARKDGTFTPGERTRTFRDLGFAALDFADVATLGATTAGKALKGAKVIYDTGGNVISAGTRDFKLNQLHGILKNQPDGQQLLQKVKDFEQGGVDTLTAYETVAKDQGKLPWDYGPTQTAPVRSEPGVVNFETTYGGGYAKGYTSSIYFRPTDEPVGGAGLTDVAPHAVPEHLRFHQGQRLQLTGDQRIEQQRGGGFGGSVPELPGVGSYSQVRDSSGRIIPRGEVDAAARAYGTKASPHQEIRETLPGALTERFGPTHINPQVSPDLYVGQTSTPGSIGPMHLTTDVRAFPTYEVPPRTFREAEGTASPSALPQRQPWQDPLDDMRLGPDPDSYSLGLRGRLDDPQPGGGTGMTETPSSLVAPSPIDAGRPAAFPLAHRTSPPPIQASLSPGQLTPPAGTPRQTFGEGYSGGFQGTATDIPMLQTQSGLLLPASAVPAEALATGVQTSPATGVEYATTVSPQTGPAQQTDTATAAQVEAVQRLQTAAQTATQIEIAPGLRTVVQPETAAQVEVAPGLRNGPQVQPELAPGTHTTPSGRTWTIDIPGPGGRTPGQPRPWEIDIPGPKTGTPGQPQTWEIDLPGPKTGGRPWEIDIPATHLNPFTLPDLGTAPRLDLGPGLSGQQHLEADERAAEGWGTGDIPDPRPVNPEEDIGRFDASTVRRRPEEERKSDNLRRRVEQPIPDDAHPVEDRRPLRDDEYPRHVAHEELVLDVDRGDGSVDRVLVDVGDPKVTAADRTPPPAGEHIAGNQRIVASGQTVTGENVNPVLPPRDAAEQHPEGEVEEAVFITDLDSGETTVHRYREEREAGESLEDQLERLSEEDRQVAAAEPAQEESRPGRRSNLERAQAILAAAGAGAGAAAHTAAQGAGSALERGRALAQAGREHAGTAMEKGRTVAQAGTQHAGTALDRGRAIAQAANKYVDEHAPETKSALLERAQQITGKANQGKGGNAQPQSFDKFMAGLIKSQGIPSGAQKNAPKNTSRRSSSRTTEKDLKKVGRSKRKIVVYVD